ncbi:MAG: Tim44 domain-containing protein [Dechloromonas sp.]|uniref:Tim44 domain-containing protein n=1 Tax=Candidatus Dechloromonas phosphorivorans TaxID=2899244 RepID=A0A9D7QJB1_9RHOO|nr:Tim44 domain-containing protein [Candidatus Dechloromonas phosphorivorans]
MKSFALMTAALVLGLTLITGDAEAAKRLGGGKSAGMQRESVSAQKSTNAAPAPSQAAAPAPQAAPGAPAAQPKRSWMGPLAGLAAGLGLAALASHFGFGEGLANMMMIGLLIMAVVMVIGFIMRRRAAARQPEMAGGMQYAGAGPDFSRSLDVQPAPSSPAAFGGAAPVPATTVSGGGNIPAGFDVDAFVRNAKVNFIRLQAANDAGNLEDIREFTTPEMFGEIKLNFVDRGQGAQQTDVVTVNAEVLDVAEESERYIVSVHFSGLIREAANTPAEPFDEIWHMVKPRAGGGWVLAGIQQAQ